MFPLGQEWIAPFVDESRRLQFANGADEGIYNAVLALLNDDQQMLEYGAPIRKSRNDRFNAGLLVSENPGI